MDLSTVVEKAQPERIGRRTDAGTPCGSLKTAALGPKKGRIRIQNARLCLKNRCPQGRAGSTPALGTTPVLNGLERHKVASRRQRSKLVGGHAISSRARASARGADRRGGGRGVVRGAPGRHSVLRRPAPAVGGV